jgi:hypothetical protein
MRDTVRLRGFGATDFARYVREVWLLASGWQIQGFNDSRIQRFKD